MTTAALLGLGHMGLPMALHLQDGVSRLVGFDPVAAARTTATEAGLVTASSATEAVDGAEAVFLVLPNSDVVERAVAEILPTLAPGAVIVDMSSSDPVRTRHLAEQLRAEGHPLVDAPVSGGVRGAEAGALTIMAGGLDAVGADVRALLDTMGTIVQTGDVGSGHATKALNNLVSAAHLWATSEAVLAGAAFGLDPATLVAAIDASSGRSGSSAVKWPRHILTGRYDSGFSLSLMRKDIGTATGLIDALGAEGRLSHAVLDAWSAAAADLPPDADHTHVAAWIAHADDTTPPATRGTDE